MSNSKYSNQKSPFNHHLHLAVKKLELNFFSIKFPSAAILSKLNEHNIFSSLNVSHYLILIATYTSRVDGCTRLVLHNSWYEATLICFNTLPDIRHSIQEEQNHKLLKSRVVSPCQTHLHFFNICPQV